MKKLFLFSVVLLSTFSAFSQMPDPWRIYYYPDNTSNGKDNAKIIRSFCGNNDTLMVGSYFFNADGITAGIGVIGKNSDSWYLFDSSGAAKLVPYKDYIGKGLFAVKNNARYDVYSINSNKVIFEGLDSFIPFDPDKLYQQVLSVGIKNNEKYIVNELGRIVFEKENVLPADSTVKNRYYHGIELKQENGGKRKLVPCKYENFQRDYFFSYGKLKGKYYIYNELMQLLAETSKEPYSVIGGLISVKKGNKYGVIDLSGIMIVPCEFDSISQESVVKAFKKDKTLIFLPSGKIIFETNKTGANYYLKTLNEMYYDDPGMKDRETLVYDESSNKAIEASKYQNIRYLTNPSLKLIKVKQNNKFGLIDLNEKIVLPFEYDSISDYILPKEAKTVYDGIYLLKKGNTCFFVDRNLKQRGEKFEDVDPSILQVYDKRPTIIWVKNNGKYDVVNFIDFRVLYKGADSVSISYVSSGVKEKTTPAVRIFKAGQSFLIDNTGKKYFVFKHVMVVQSGDHVKLVDTYLNKVPLDITPMVTINDCIELNVEHDYAIVYCLNRYFVINKYGEVSFGTEVHPELYDYKTGNIYSKHLKSSKGLGLYDFKGRELGKMSKYPVSYQEFDMATNECYYLFIDSKKRKGLMRSNGELVLNCEYLDIGTINEGKCEVWGKKGEDPYLVDLKGLKPLEWPK